MSSTRQTISEELEGDPPTLDRATLDGLAEHVYEARLSDDAAGIAGGQCVDVATDSRLPAGYDGIALLPLRKVIVRPSHDRYTLTLRILHELAHLLLQELRWRHSHGDVWLLALAIALPPSKMRAHRPANALDAAALGAVPAWAAAVRLSLTA